MKRRILSTLHWEQTDPLTRDSVVSPQLRTLYRFNAFPELTESHRPGFPVCEGERVAVPAGAPCHVLQDGGNDRVLIQLDVDPARPLYGWTTTTTLL